ncbi:hypothetical protein IV203_003995 [Nitzschia inconspicua]|uniref:Uncharacterized protein n=1 Tax=Nitzschia inconspicua TaxID=303405 RepID=A0A9K3L3L9_9STRA|nr:hypothetical protein IV203_003995 [Nitzschia inconspicua]
MHLYLNGGFYLMSQHLTELAAHEAKKMEHIIPNIRLNLPRIECNDPHGYLEGVEDHDAMALIEHGLYNSLENIEYKDNILQWWLILLKDNGFLSHPVKTAKKFEHLMRREQDKSYSQDSDAILHAPVDWQQESTKTLLVTFGATTASMREEYWSELQSQGHQACNALQEQTGPVPCDIYNFFVVGDTSMSVQAENKMPQLENHTKASRNSKKDVLFLNVDNKTTFVWDLPP